MEYLTAVLLSLGVTGAYAILAVGIVMIYRASRVLNLAHGAMAMFPPYVVYALANGNFDPLWAAIFAGSSGLAIASSVNGLLRRRLAAGPRTVASVATLFAGTLLLYALFRSQAPLWMSLPLGMVAGGALGWAVERFFIRPLRSEGPTAQTVGTVAALGVLIAVTAKIFGTATLNSVGIFPDGAVQVGESFIRYGEFGLFGVMLVVTGALILLLQRTDLGLMMRGAAENRRAAALMGVDPDRMTALAWIMGGTLAGLSGILLASITNLHPYTLSLQALPAFVAALIAGLASLQGAVAGAAVVGASIGLVPALPLVKDWQGAKELFLAAVAIVVMAMRGGRLAAGDVRGDPGGTLVAARKATERPAPRDPERVARLRRRWATAGAFVFLAFPWVPWRTWDSVLGSANDAARFTLVATSLVLLVGWVGQISLGHAALVGVGAYATGMLASGLGIPFPLNLPLSIAASALIAAALGAVAVRVRGLYLAVATLIFSWMADTFLFKQGWLLEHGQIPEPAIGTPNTFPFFDFTDRRVFYFVGWAMAIFAIYLAANVRDSKTGRAFFAVRGSEMAAASLGIDVVRTKFLAFALSGALAGAAGGLQMVHQGSVNPDSFRFDQSFFFLSIIVVGGLQSLGGAVAASFVFASLSLLFFRVQALAGFLDIVSTGLLALVLLTYREGLAAVPASLAPLRARARRAAARLARFARPAVRPLAGPASGIASGARAAGRRAAAAVGAAGRRLSGPPVAVLKRFRPVAAATGNGPGPASGDAEAAAAPGHRLLSRAGPGRELAADRADRSPLIQVEGLTVRFGGLIAVDDVSLSVREGEIVGLIGPNGAGKTVTFNAISGIVTPTKGRIRLRSADVTSTPVHERAQMGLARTFQILQLFGQLSVFENLLVATHVHNPTGLGAHILASERSIAAEVEARERVREVETRLGLGDVADRRVADLPFGVLRIVEVARALVTGHPLIMFDEPASGLDNTETDKLSELLRFVRDLGITLLLIEHDVKLVTSVSDYMYVLDRGRLISEGPPATVKSDPAVIAAYLGTAGEPAEAKAG